LSLTGLTEGNHEVVITETDAAGNSSDPATINWTVSFTAPDTTAPEAPQMTGVPSAQTNSTSATISFTGESGGSYMCAVDGGSYSACTSPWSVTGLGDGAHSFAVKQTDDSANTGGAATTAWTVDTVAPSAPTIAGLPRGLTISPNANATFTSSEQGVTFECRMGLTGTPQPCTSPWNITGLTAGAKTASVRAVDPAGNVSSWVSKSWTVRNPCARPTLKNPIFTAFPGGRLWIKPRASAADPRPACQPLTIQMWDGPNQPSDADHLTDTPTFTMRIAKYRPTVIFNGGKGFIPKWIRVENKVGTWTSWQPLNRTGKPR
jgi:hypothetical protein